jgi:hypothetical protein
MREMIAVPLAAMEKSFSCITIRTIVRAQRAVPIRSWRADAIVKQIFWHLRDSFIHSGKHHKGSAQKSTVQSANSIQRSFSSSNQR